MINFYHNAKSILTSYAGQILALVILAVCNYGNNIQIHPKISKNKPYSQHFIEKVSLKITNFLYIKIHLPQGS